MVLDASAGVEIALQTPDGLRIESLLPEPTTFWVPEHYFSEVAGPTTQRDQRPLPAARVQVAFDKLLTSPTNSVAVKPLLSEARTMRHRYRRRMAMTLRLSDEEQELLRRRAAEEGVSMQEVARRAVREYVGIENHRDRVFASARRVLAAHADAIERLGR